MKYSYTVATPETSDPNMLAMRGDLRTSFAVLAELGYHGAELMVRDPAQLEAREILALAREFNLEIPAISTGQLATEDGLSLAALDSDIRAKTIGRMQSVIDFAAALRAQVNIGTLRGRLPAGRDREPSLAAARQSFSDLLAYAEARGVGLAVEPQNRYVVNWLHQAAETDAWLDSFTHRNSSILFDVYHAFFEEDSLYASLIQALPRISHIQFSDTNRLPPGRGQANFHDIVRVLEALGYARFISVECLQQPDARSAAEASARCLMLEPRTGALNT